jgi:acyl carrier protein
MTDDAARLRRTVLDALTQVAPDVDLGTLDHTRAFRDQFDFDSMDYLNFVTALHRALGVDIRESEYPQLATVDGAVQYLIGALAK